MTLKVPNEAVPYAPKQMGRWLGAWLGLGLLAALPAGAEPGVSAKSAIVIDGTTGQLLYGKAIHDRRPQASTTKMMAAIIALEHGRLDDLVQVSTKSAEINGSSIYLQAGERLTFAQLLYGMMLSSGNDATNAVAEYVAGDTDRFVTMMNQKAVELGLKDTHYTNPHGLPVANHYSSAYDLAMIARYALANPKLAEIAATKAIELPGNGRIARRLLVNHNKLLRYFPGAWAGKTGYTTVAGKCFVGSAKRNGRYVIEALLDAPDCWADAEHLLNYGLDQFDSIALVKPGESLGTVDLVGGAQPKVSAVVQDAVQLSVPKGHAAPQFERALELDSGLHAPITAGQTVGRYTVRQKGQVIAEVPLVAEISVPAVGPVLGDLSALFAWFLKGGTLSVALFSVFRWQGVRRRRRRPGPLLRVSNAIHRSR